LQPGKLLKKVGKELQLLIKVHVELQLEGCRVAIRVLKIIKKYMFRDATEALEELQLK
jgi:hypothetical protein